MQTNVPCFLNFFVAFFGMGCYTICMETKMCVLDEEKECDGCLECLVCDLDPTKICDNCGKCLDIRDYATIKIDKIIMDPAYDPDDDKKS